MSSSSSSFISNGSRSNASGSTTGAAATAATANTAVRNAGVRIVTFGDGRLNPLGWQTRQSLRNDLMAALEDTSVSSIVLMGRGNTNFSAGADLTEFDTVNNDNRTNNNDNDNDNDIISLPDLVDYIETSSKPIVAAIRGVALGGGLEVALSCHYRIGLVSAKATTQLGLPEVTVGVIPGAGGTQRLPKCIGLQSALRMILTGKSISAQRAHDIGLLDAIVNVDDHDHDAIVSLSNLQQDSLFKCAMEWAVWVQLMSSSSPLALERRRLSRRVMMESPSMIKQLLQRAALTLPPKQRGGVFQHLALRAIEAGCITTTQQPYYGMRRERQLFMEALAHGAGQRHAFFAVRAVTPKKATKYDTSNTSSSSLSLLLSTTTKEQTTVPVHVGVIGAGTMGSGIALVLLQAGYVVHLVDVQPQALLKGMTWIQHTILKKNNNRNTTLLSSKERTNDDDSTTSTSNVLLRLKSSTDVRDLKNCLLIVEAIVENLDIKRDMFRTLDKVVRAPNALLLSNTSTLDIDEIANVLPPHRRPYVAGWHFFSPAHVMKLIEIVVGTNTSQETLTTIQSLTKYRLRNKIGVTVGNCNGFVGNRMLEPYTTECCLLVAEGSATIESVDTTMYNFGFPLGVFAMSDLAGNDIGYFIRKEKGLVKDPTTGIGPNRTPGMRYTDLGDELVSKLGRVGQKAGKGWYDYDPSVGKGRKPLPSPEVTRFVRNYVAINNKTSSNKQKDVLLSSDQIIERVLFPLVNEGFKILEEGIAARPSDVDVIYLYGYGWPSWKGGPMFWADHDVGLSHLLARLRHFHRQFPGSIYYKPSRLLEQCVQRGVTVEEYFKGRQLAASSRSRSATDSMQRPTSKL